MAFVFVDCLGIQLPSSQTQNITLSSMLMVRQVGLSLYRIEPQLVVVRVEFNSPCHFILVLTTSEEQFSKQ